MMFGVPCASLGYIPKTKSRPKSKSPIKRTGVRYKFSRANADVDKFYIGDIWFGKTNNILPDEWQSGEAELKIHDDSDKLILHFDITVVVITITTDVQFLKDLLYIRLFKFDLKLDDENIIASLYLNKIPLPKFSNKIGSVLKTVFSLTHNICCEYNEINSIKSSSTVEHFDDLYKNISTLRENIPDKLVRHDQLKPKLRPYQQCAVRWMLYRESLTRDHALLHPLYQKVTLLDGSDIYFDKHTGYIELAPPMTNYFQSGGILADEMGLGKTVEVLALLLLHRRPREENVNISEQNNVQIKLKLHSKEPVLSEINSYVDNTSQHLENSSNTSANETTLHSEAGCPTVQAPSRKRKLRRSESDLKDAYTITEKKIKQQSNVKKSALRIALESWYDEMLGGTKNRVKSIPLVQCICGDVSDLNAVECSGCGRIQHAICLGYKSKYGSYICPQCWMEQPLLESKATLIVTPMSLKQQWCDEICKHISGELKVLHYESGQNIKCIYPKELQEYDIVITTYSVLQSELNLTESGLSVSLRRPAKYLLPGSPITLVNWWRLCLDEAQSVDTPGTKVSIMAKKLNAQYRWAITGTPISKDISDLYGLVDYLQISPYCELETWENILYKPYINSRKTNMHRFLAEVLWRTSKNDVLDQINIPAQTVKEHWIEFTAVEKFFYDREHELSCKEFLSKLRNMDLTLPLSLLNKSILRKIMVPLLALRKACVHHQTVRGKYLATRKQVSSMEDLLDALTTKSFVQCEESLRSIVSAMNGLASIFLLQDNPKTAAEMYRKVLGLSQQFLEQENEIVLEVDKLQLIHVIYNLIEILELNKTIPQKPDDDLLRDRWIKLEEEYLDKFMKPIITSLSDNTNINEQISELQKKFILSPGQWFTDTLDWVTINKHFSEYCTKLETLCWNAHITIRFNCRSERSVMYKISTWDEKLTEVKDHTVLSIKELLVFDESQNVYNVPITTIKQAAECHLRPNKKSNSKKSKGPMRQCPICVANGYLKEYESILFSSEQQADDKANTGTWKPALEEVMLRALHSIGKTHKGDKDLLHDGTTHLKILELLRKEFKEIRKLWTLINALVCAKDELDMCKIRLQIKESNSEEGSPQQSRLLKKLDYEIQNKLDDIYYLEASEIPYQLAHLSSQERCGVKMLEENMGTYKYLQTLHKQQMKGEDPDPCPICKCILNKQWNIMPCGHCYCVECMEVLIGQQPTFKRQRYINCAICRKTIRVSDISYLHKDEKKTETEDLQIKGNCSSKVEAVIKLILKLKADDENVKVLVFSTWVALLKLMETIFSRNDISSKILTSQNCEKSLNNFKDMTKQVTALLLPVHLGGKGLNLIEATHIIFVEPLLNPGDELQAIGRIHRIGQTRSTIVHKFFIKNTIEESIYHTMSSNTKEWDPNRVTLGHFKQLFDYACFSGNMEETQDLNTENLSSASGTLENFADDQTPDATTSIDEVDMIDTSSNICTSFTVGLDTNLSVTSIDTSADDIHGIELLSSSCSTASTSVEEAVMLALNTEIADEVDTLEEAEVIDNDGLTARIINSKSYDDERSTKITRNHISITEYSYTPFTNIAATGMEDVDTTSLSYTGISGNDDFEVTSISNNDPSSILSTNYKNDNPYREKHHGTALGGEAAAGSSASTSDFSLSKAFICHNGYKRKANKSFIANWEPSTTDNDISITNTVDEKLLDNTTSAEEDQSLMLTSLSTDTFTNGNITLDTSITVSGLTNLGGNSSFGDDTDDDKSTESSLYLDVTDAKLNISIDTSLPLSNKLSTVVEESASAADLSTRNWCSKDQTSKRLNSVGDTSQIASTIIFTTKYETFNSNEQWEDSCAVVNDRTLRTSNQLDRYKEVVEITVGEYILQDIFNAPILPSNSVVNHGYIYDDH